jgi:hypothetical protein
MTKPCPKDIIGPENNSKIVLILTPCLFLKFKEIIRYKCLESTVRFYNYLKLFSFVGVSKAIMIRCLLAESGILVDDQNVRNKVHDDYILLNFKFKKRCTELEQTNK